MQIKNTTVQVNTRFQLKPITLNEGKKADLQAVLRMQRVTALRFWKGARDKIELVLTTEKNNVGIVSLSPKIGTKTPS